jgi:enolase
VVSIEDPFDQDDWEGYQKLTAEIGDKIQIVGDDLLVTNPKRIEQAIQKKTCNALLLKVRFVQTTQKLLHFSFLESHWLIPR